MTLAIVDLFSKLARAALLPHSLQRLDAAKRATFGSWREKSESTAEWLPSCVRCVRSCIATLTPLDLHNDSLDVLHTLAFDMRINCVGMLLKQTIHGSSTLTSVRSTTPPGLSLKPR